MRQIVQAGGIPFIKTNIPMFLFTWECPNRLFGSNPYDITRTAGGSSGGEGALIASKCSPGGIGSDIGGSIRI